MTTRRDHWESVYRQRDHEAVSWYQRSPDRSLKFIADCGVALDEPIVDIGGGSSTLVDHLLDAGHTDVTILDLSGAALAVARTRLGSAADEVTWVEADVTGHHFDREYSVWHDRAVFHFLTKEADQARYLTRVERAVVAGGHLILATFSLDGPERCSGLAVQRYGPDSMSARLGAGWEALAFELETHHTPSGGIQEFLYGFFERASAA